MKNGFLTTEELKTYGFAKIGKEVKISRLVSFYGAKNILLGDYCRIDDFCVITASVPIFFKEYVHISTHCLIIGKAEVIFEPFSAFAAGSKLYTATDDFSGEYLTNPCVPEKYTNVKIAPVRIGRHTIIGVNSVIMPGASIGDNSATAAGTFVNKPLPENGIYGGIPAKLLKPRSQKILELEKTFLKENK